MPAEGSQIPGTEVRGPDGPVKAVLFLRKNASDELVNLAIEKLPKSVVIFKAADEVVDDQVQRRT